VRSDHWREQTATGPCANLVPPTTHIPSHRAPSTLILRAGRENRFTQERDLCGAPSLDKPQHQHILQNSTTFPVLSSIRCCDSFLIPLSDHHTRSTRYRNFYSGRLQSAAPRATDLISLPTRTSLPQSHEPLFILTWPAIFSRSTPTRQPRAARLLDSFLSASGSKQANH
jgi:hypothetical protein